MLSKGGIAGGCSDRWGWDIVYGMAGWLIATLWIAFNVVFGFVLYQANRKHWRENEIMFYATMVCFFFFSGVFVELVMAVLRPSVH